MSQFDFGTIDPYVVDGVELADFLNQWRDAIYSLHRGSTRPAYVVPGMLWINDSGGASAWVLQWYVSPTVGDVALFTLNTTTGAIQISASAGGTFAAATLLAQAAASPMVRWNATGNPIDVKDWRMTVNGAGALVLSSYNDAGTLLSSITFNRNGTITTAGPSAGAMTLVGEQVLAATANAMQVNFGATAKLVEVWFDLTLNPATNAGIFLKATQAGVPNTGSVYSTGTANMYQPNTFAAIQGTSAFVTLITSGTQARGVMRLTKPANFIGHGHHYALDASANFYNQQIALTTGLTGVDGVQVTTSGTFAVGSYLRTLALS